MKHFVSAFEEEQIIQLYQSGFGGCQKICKALGLHRPTVNNVRRRAGLRTGAYLQGRWPSLTKDEIQVIRRLKSLGLSTRQIAHEINRAHSVVWKYAQHRHEE